MSAREPGVYRTILFPTDFSPASEGARDEALALARKSGAALLLMHVVESTADAGVDLEMQDFYRALLRRAEDEFDRRFPADVLGDVSAERLVRTGRPSSEILAVVDERAVDLIVIGSHGVSGVVRGAFGSLAFKLSVAAPCPVLIVKPPPFRGRA